MSRNTADTTGAVGASGTGKGLFVKARVRSLDLAARPLVVWSPLEETDRYGATFSARVVRSVGDAIKAYRAGVRRIVVLPTSDPKKIGAQFDLFCRLVWELQGCVAVVEELSRVTSPSFAPQAWQNLSTAGRHRGISLIATAQRPAQVDKDFFGNCTELRAYRVNYENDARALASIMREPADTFLELPDLHYLHRWIRERRNERGIQPLPGVRASPGRVAKKPPRVRATLPGR